MAVVKSSSKRVESPFSVAQILFRQRKKDKNKESVSKAASNFLKKRALPKKSSTLRKVRNAKELRGELIAEFTKFNAIYDDMFFMDIFQKIEELQSKSEAIMDFYLGEEMRHEIIWEAKKKVSKQGAISMIELISNSSEFFLDSSEVMTIFLEKQEDAEAIVKDVMRVLSKEEAVEIAVFALNTQAHLMSIAIDFKNGNIRVADSFDNSSAIGWYKSFMENYLENSLHEKFGKNFSTIFLGQQERLSQKFKGDEAIQSGFIAIVNSAICVSRPSDDYRKIREMISDIFCEEIEGDSLEEVISDAQRKYDEAQDLQEEKFSRETLQRRMALEDAAEEIIKELYCKSSVASLEESDDETDLEEEEPESSCEPYEEAPLKKPRNELKTI